MTKNNNNLNHKNMEHMDDFEKQLAEIAQDLKKAVDPETHQQNLAEIIQFFQCQHNKFLAVGNKFRKIIKYLGRELEAIDDESGLTEPEEYFETTLFALAKVAELRDPETSYHLERTREYSVQLSRQLELDKKFIEQIYRVGPLHDIGKVGIKDSILLKPGKLDETEFAEMKKHTLIGAETIRNVIGKQRLDKNYINMAEEIALSHHEKFDGSGYPQNLKGEDIPLAARIFALADAYDAIISRRPYKEPLPHETAVERITNDAGSHFDPEIVRAFLEIEKEFAEINETYSQDREEIKEEVTSAEDEAEKEDKK